MASSSISEEYRGMSGCIKPAMTMLADIAQPYVQVMSTVAKESGIEIGEDSIHGGRGCLVEVSQKIYQSGRDDDTTVGQKGMVVAAQGGFPSRATTLVEIDTGYEITKDPVIFSLPSTEHISMRYQRASNYFCSRRGIQMDMVAIETPGIMPPSRSPQPKHRFPVNADHDGDGDESILDDEAEESKGSARRSASDLQENPPTKKIRLDGFFHTEEIVCWADLPNTNCKRAFELRKRDLSPI
ncbi:hypothetical protein DFH07DRAFT_1034868 [Mycena maculata]|uniref:Uncharacterized protein n=1 Tax=Mycena maculata TaxID=230809 RepID=A0AAD7ISQ5_9AGAR|nr:hypothetical protein DFH07DRAFT_1034868 [Mycena maculata]